MMGRDTLIFPALMFGARGAVPATGNIAPALLAEIYNAFQRGDLEASKAAQLRLNPLRLALGLCTAPGGVKAALDSARPADRAVPIAGFGPGARQTAEDASGAASGGIDLRHEHREMLVIHALERFSRVLELQDS